jgi:hypothetical protein
MYKDCKGRYHDKELHMKGMSDAMYSQQFAASLYDTPKKREREREGRYRNIFLPLVTYALEE